MTRVQLHRAPPPNATLSLAQLEQGFLGETGAVTTGVAFGADTWGFAESSLLTQTGVTQSAKVLTYINALPNLSTHRCIAGQMMENNAPQFGPITQLHTDTGKWVGLFGTAYTYDLGTVNSMVNTAWTTGMLVTGICTFKNPQTGGAETDTTAAIHNTVTAGTAAHSNFFGVQLPALASTLSGIIAATPGVCLIIRPFREENGTWFWWGNASKPDFTSLWQQTYTYLNVTAGLAGSLLFDYNVYVGQGNYTKNYPGDAFVDVISFDYYGDNPATDCAATYSSLTGITKPIHWAEFGPHNSAGPIAPNSFDNTVVLNAIKTNFPKCFAVSCWNNGWAWDTQNNASTLMNDTVMATGTDVNAPTRFA